MEIKDFYLYEHGIVCVLRGAGGLGIQRSSDMNSTFVTS